MQYARRSGGLSSIALALVLAVIAACTGGRDDLSQHQHELEERLLAPCCWRQSLADHESPVATTLRAEIHDRLSRRETPASIEADFVRRYGDKVRALPEGGDPRWIVGVTAASAALIALGALAWFVGRRRASPSVAGSTEPVDEGEYADRLDDELLAVD